MKFLFIRILFDNGFVKLKNIIVVFWILDFKVNNYVFFDSMSFVEIDIIMKFNCGDLRICDY